MKITFTRVELDQVQVVHLYRDLALAVLYESSDALWGADQPCGRVRLNNRDQLAPLVKRLKYFPCLFDAFCFCARYGYFLAANNSLFNCSSIR